MSNADLIILSISLLSIVVFAIQHFVYKRKIKKLQEQDLSSSQRPFNYAKNVIVHYYDEHGGDDCKEELQEKQQEVEQLKKWNAELENNISILEQKIIFLEKEYEKKVKVLSEVRMGRNKEEKRMEENECLIEELKRRNYEKESQLKQLEKELENARKAAPKSDNIAIQELEKKIHQLYADQKREKENMQENFEREKMKILDAQSNAMVAKGKEIALLRQTIEKQLEEINILKNKQNK